MRARDLGIELEGETAQHNAITDVTGVEVGYTTLIEGEAVRTGVTAILPRGKASKDPVFAAWFPLNGNGEMTGTTWIDESGFLEGPVMLTNTHSVGVVQSAVVGWQHRTGKMFQPFSYPVVAETYDGSLNDINGFHVKPEHAVAAIESARSGPIAEGSVGGGTGMVCYQFKGGSGTSSRKTVDGFTVGVFAQCNFGRRPQLVIAGVPVGKKLPLAAAWAPDTSTSAVKPQTEQGSIIIVVATDAPLLPHQLKRVAKRTALGMARTGAHAGNSSGDIMLAFSTANPGAANPDSGIAKVDFLSNEKITQIFDATIYATEEAILNAMVSAETMTGVGGRVVDRLPHDRVRELLKR